MAGDTKQMSSSPSFFRDFSHGFERLPWWWVAGSSLVFLLAIVLGDAVQTDNHHGLGLKSLAVGLGVILVGNAILAVAVVRAERRRAQRKDAAPQPGRDA
jgi:drug/metabolite transporter (DMT)-like permease